MYFLALMSNKCHLGCSEQSDSAIFETKDSDRILSCLQFYISSHTSEYKLLASIGYTNSLKESDTERMNNGMRDENFLARISELVIRVRFLFEKQLIFSKACYDSGSLRWNARKSIQGLEVITSSRLQQVTTPFIWRRPV
jgi:hypothetical protein